MIPVTAHRATSASRRANEEMGRIKKTERKRNLTSSCAPLGSPPPSAVPFDGLSSLPSHSSSYFFPLFLDQPSRIVFCSILSRFPFLSGGERGECSRGQRSSTRSSPYILLGQRHRGPGRSAGSSSTRPPRGEGEQRDGAEEERIDLSQKESVRTAGDEEKEEGGRREKNRRRERNDEDGRNRMGEEIGRGERGTEIQSGWVLEVPISLAYWRGIGAGVGVLVRMVQV